MKRKLYNFPGCGRKDGFTLVEMMVALLIGSFLMAGLIQVFLSNKVSYRYSEGLARMQENARFAMDVMIKKMRMAGYLGCAGNNLGKVTNKLNDSGDTEWNMTVGIEGYDASGTNPGSTYTITATNPAPSGTASNWNGSGAGNNLPSPYLTTPAIVIPGTDVVIVRGMDGSGISVPGKTDSGQLFACYDSPQTAACEDGSDAVEGICENDILLVSDCNLGYVFQATNLQQVGAGSGCGPQQRANVVHAVAGGSSDPGNTPPAWSDDLDDNAELLKLTTTVFYIGQGAYGGPSLYQKISTGTPQELAPGVESLQILYGEDTDSDAFPNYYAPADQVVDFERVVSVRFSFLIRSEDTVNTENDTRTYNLVGTTINPVDDKRLRRVMTATVVLRNRQ